MPLNREQIVSQIQVGRRHQAVVDRREIDDLPGVFAEVRIRRGWEVDYELMWRLEDDSGPVWIAEGVSLDDAIDLVEQLLGCDLEDCDAEEPLPFSGESATAAAVGAAILEGRIPVTREFKLTTWWFATGDYWARLGSEPPGS